MSCNTKTSIDKRIEMWSNVFSYMEESPREPREPSSPNVSLAIEKYVGMENRSTDDSVQILDRIDNNPEKTRFVAKFGFRKSQRGFDNRVYIFPRGQTTSKPVEISKPVENVKKGNQGNRPRTKEKKAIWHALMSIGTKDKKVTREQEVTNEITIFTGITPAGPIQIIIDDPETLTFMQRAINENLVVLRPNTTESKLRVGNEDQEKQELYDRGVPQYQGMIEPDGTDLQIGLLRFRGDQIIHNPTKEALQNAIKDNI